MQITMDRPHWSPKETLGFSDLAHGDGSGGVYYPAVLALVRDMRGEAPQLLAAAMFHEVDHLILGENAHTRAGVMCGDWEPGTVQTDQRRQAGLRSGSAQATSDRSAAQGIGERAA